MENIHYILKLRGYTKRDVGYKNRCNTMHFLFLQQRLADFPVTESFSNSIDDFFESMTEKKNVVLAVMLGRVNLLKCLLLKGSDPDELYFNNTALMICASRNIKSRRIMIKILVNFGASLNIVNSEGQTAYDLVNDFTPDIRELLRLTNDTSISTHVRPTIKLQYTDSPVYSAYFFCSTNFSDPNEKRYLIPQTSCRGQLLDSRCCLSDREYLQIQNRQLYGMLKDGFHSWSKHPSFVKTFLGPQIGKKASWYVKTYQSVSFSEANINDRHEPWQFTPLIAAVVVNDYCKVCECISLNADVNVQTDTGLTALHQAVINESVYICEIILKTGLIDHSIQYLSLTPRQLVCELYHGKSPIRLLFS